MDWYYANGDQQQGPHSEPELAGLVQAGTINAATLVWSEGMPDWQPLGAVRPDLAGGGASAVALAKDLSVQAMREGASGSLEMTELRYAGFWIRFGAWLIDYILMCVVMVPLQLVLQTAMVAGGRGGQNGAVQPALMGGAFLMLMLASLAIPVLYKGLMVGKFGATLGKMACGLKVVMPDGSPVTMGRGFGRALGEILSALVIYIGYIIAAFDEEKRALHDHIASTRVIRAR